MTDVRANISARTRWVWFQWTAACDLESYVSESNLATHYWYLALTLNLITECLSTGPLLILQRAPCVLVGEGLVLDSVHPMGICFPLLPLLLTGFVALASLSNASLMLMPRTTAFWFLLWLTLDLSYRKCDQIRDTWPLGVSPQGLVSSRILELLEEGSHAT